MIFKCIDNAQIHTSKQDRSISQNHKYTRTHTAPAHGLNEQNIQPNRLSYPSSIISEYHNERLQANCICIKKDNIL